MGPPPRRHQPHAGFLAPSAAATGIAGAGTSLDNTLRMGRLVDTEWVLLDVEGSFARNGYGHGHCHVWAEDGTLLATASQSSPLLIFEG